jgi:hypothetical protein
MTIMNDKKQQEYNDSLYDNKKKQGISIATIFLAGVIALVCSFIMINYMGSNYVLKTDDINNWQPVIQKIEDLEKHMQQIDSLLKSVNYDSSELNIIIKEALEEYYSEK